MSPNDAGRAPTPRAARGPRVFKTHDPTLVDIDSAASETDAAAGGGEGAPPASSPARDGTLALPTRAGITRGIRWGALFVSAGGYHHHIGLNTWAGEGMAAPPPGALGLHRFTVLLPDDASLSEVRASVAAAGPGDGSAELADPSGNRILLTTR